jgi:hypothetical protein
MTDELAGGGPAIGYTPTIEDYVAFNLYHLRHSPVARRAKWRAVVLMGFFVLLACAVVSYMTRSSWGTYVVQVILCALIVVYSAWRYDHNVAVHVRRHLREGRNAAQLSPHTVRIAADGIVEATTLNEATYRWPAIERVAESDDHLFIYIGAAQAIGIPKHRIESGDYAAFVARLHGTIPDRFLPPGATATPKGPLPPPYAPSGPRA